MTVIARAPLRISLAGGGTDLPVYADRFGGLCVSTSINRYVYVIMTEAGEEVLQVTAADSSSEFCRHGNLYDSALFWGADYRLPMEILDHFKVKGGRRFFIASEVPPGTGLGSSSATAVAMINAIMVDQGLSMNREEVAELACQIEIERMGMPIGRQDQFASSCGGLNMLEFSQGRTRVRPCNVSDETYDALRKRILLFFTGKTRRSTDILTKQREATGIDNSSTLHALHEIKLIALDMLAAIEGDEIDRVGELLDASWWRKRELAPGVSNGEIDYWYQEAVEAGAAGGKITGAGGGGFLMLYADPEKHSNIIQRMSELGLAWIDADFEKEGATPVMPAASVAVVAK